MDDLVFVALSIVFFLVSLAYVRALRPLEIGASMFGYGAASGHLRFAGGVFAGGAVVAGEVLAMTANGWFQIGLYLLILLAITKPLGVYMARVFSGERTFFDPIARPVERLLYRVTGVDEKSEMRWTEYAFSMLIFSVVSLVLLYAIERLQYWLPWNPQRIAGVAPALAFNTAVSFTTNTNWQVYSGETTMSYLTQMAGLAYHNFASAAAGIAMAIALIRGIARKEKNTIGNFWVDFTRAILWVLLPLCLIIGLFLVSQGTDSEPEALYHGSADGRADGTGHWGRWKNRAANDNRANDRARASGVTGSDQDAGHQWRRLFQCE